MSAGSNHPSTSSAGGGGGGGPCGACKFLRRKCVAECIFAPYFNSDQGAAHFAAVHKVFGASNVTKLLMHIPVSKRLDAVITICYEAQARLRDPVHGCVAQIFTLQQQVTNLQAELSYFQAHLASLEAATRPPQSQPLPPAQSQFQFSPAGLSITDLPTTTCIPTGYDLSSLFDPILQPSSWTTQRMHQRQVSGDTTTTSLQAGGGAGNDNIQESSFVPVSCGCEIPPPPHGIGDERV